MEVRAETVMAAVMGTALAMLFITPFLSPFGRFAGLDGTVGYIDHLDMWYSCDPLTFVTYLMGDIFCPQIESRSIIINGSQMAFCARDVSIAAGLFAGSLLTFSSKVRPTLRTLIAFCIVASFLMMADWSVQHFFLVDTMLSRVVTGLLFGTSVSLLVCRVFSGKVGPRRHTL